jgi:hypothetical protein
MLTKSYYIIGVEFPRRTKNKYLFHSWMERDESYNGYSIKPEIHHYITPDFNNASKYQSESIAMNIMQKFIPQILESYSTSLKKITPKQFKIFKVELSCSPL